jgi:hypothetical protein
VVGGSGAVIPPDLDATDPGETIRSTASIRRPNVRFRWSALRFPGPGVVAIGWLKKETVTKL